MPPPSSTPSAPTGNRCPPTSPWSAHAAELLELAGARTELTPLIDGDPRASVRAAMGALGLLDEATFASPRVLDAARAARHALRRLG